MKSTASVLKMTKEGRLNDAAQVLRFASEKHIRSLKSLPQKQKDLLVAVLENKHMHINKSGVNNALHLEAIKQISHNLLSSDQWKFLYGLFLRNGLLRIGFVCRENALKTAICEAEIDPISSNKLANATKASIENLNIQKKQILKMFSYNQRRFISNIIDDLLFWKTKDYSKIYNYYNRKN